ncbi:hypothetical protein [Paraburkholderia sp. SIMBA_054]|uniref:hypothetical protein n=1 Tax=Paraburkholderia sp. SIMBA_054 TaxID=3085795 RepID=UPI00397DD9C3
MNVKSRLTKALVSFAIPALLSACGEHAQPGSSLAARFAAAEVVGKAYEVDPVRVNAEPVISGETANVVAEFKGGTCNVELGRSESAEPYGWLAKRIACVKTT